MKQLTQSLKDGKMELIEVPIPAIDKGRILVKTHYSAISAGTEGRSVRDARLGYVGKAKSRPKEFKQVIVAAKKIGVAETFDMVMSKLKTPSPLGYSCAGEVMEVGEGVTKFQVGDFVACGGQGAHHAGAVAVYENLCVKVPKQIDLKHAAFTTIASIAIQGIRQADLRLGESCAIIGLGLLGQFTIQLLNAAGIKTIGVDLDEEKVNLSKKNGIDFAFARNQEGIVEEIYNITDGYGVDAVIITAATTSDDPINLAGSVSRTKGKVVSVGRVSTNFNRDIYYNKELDLRMSCSYGPGRYDMGYEEKGNDYPIGYVRWTENRNMQAFIDLLSKGKINMDNLLTHEFAFEEAPKAYDIISSSSEPFLGMVLKHDFENTNYSDKIIVNKSNIKVDQLNVGFIGAGSFAQKFLLPNVADMANMVAVATNTGIKSKHIATKYKFGVSTTNGNKVIQNKDVNTVFIATRHNSHAAFVLEAIKNNKNVFVEKPLCLKEEELEQIRQEYEKKSLHLMVGFNRRFAPQVKQIIDALGADSMKTINYRVNLGPLAADHWTQDAEIGGGRIIGEVCHFIDLAMHISNSSPTMLTAFSVNDPLALNNTLSVIIKFKNGSVASINYYANGNADLNKEYLEVHANGISAVLDDFHKLTIYGKTKKTTKSKMDKGHKTEVAMFIDSVKNGTPCPIPFDEIYWTTKMTFDVLNSIKTKKTIIYE